MNNQQTSTASFTSIWKSPLLQATPAGRDLLRLRFHAEDFILRAVRAPLPKSAILTRLGVSPEEIIFGNLALLVDAHFDAYACQSAAVAALARSGCYLRIARGEVKACEECQNTARHAAARFHGILLDVAGMLVADATPERPASEAPPSASDQELVRLAAMEEEASALFAEAREMRRERATQHGQAAYCNELIVAGRLLLARATRELEVLAAREVAK